MIEVCPCTVFTTVMQMGDNGDIGGEYEDSVEDEENDGNGEYGENEDKEEDDESEERLCS